MFSDDRSQILLERCCHAVAAVNADKAAAVGIEEVDLGMLASLTDAIDLKTGRAQRDDGVSERRAH
jgi:hypothetical protein